MTRTVRSWLRFLAAVGLLVGAGLFLQSRSRAENLPPRKALTELPKQIGTWVGRDTGIGPEVLEVLGPGEFLARIYQRSPEEPPIDFFVAYFPSQRTGDTVHSPKNCLPGAGWTPLESGQVSFSRTGRSAMTVNRYIIGQGANRMLVLYWYQSHGRAVASEYWAKFYLVADAIRLNRTDGALVRVITPIAPGEAPGSADKRVTDFGRRLLTILEEYIPS